MATFTKLTWSVQDLSAVSALQNVGVAGPLLLNGTLLDSTIPDQISFIKNKVIRSVSLTSVNDLSLTNFVITGLQNGAYVSETVSGPNNNTVYGTKYYDTITSVVASTAVNGIQVGTGDAGFLPLIAIDANAVIVNYSTSVLLPAGSGITYSMLQTLDQINTNFIPFLNQADKLFPAFGLTNETTSQIANSLLITNFVILQVNSSANPITDTFEFILLQE